MKEIKSVIRMKKAKIIHHPNQNLLYHQIYPNIDLPNHKAEQSPTPTKVMALRIFLIEGKIFQKVNNFQSKKKKKKKFCI